MLILLRQFLTTWEGISATSLLYEKGELLGSGTCSTVYGTLYIFGLFSPLHQLYSLGKAEIGVRFFTVVKWIDIGVLAIRCLRDTFFANKRKEKIVRKNYEDQLHGCDFWNLNQPSPFVLNLK